MYDETPDRNAEEDEYEKNLKRQALLEQMRTEPTGPAPDRRVQNAPEGPTPPPGLAPPGGTPPPTPPPPEAAAATPSIFQSHHGTVPGYLQAAASAYAPTVQGAKSEQDAKRLAEDYIRTLIPEIEKRGGKVGDIKNEKVMIDGKWVDLYRDIGGASEAQYLVDDGTGGGGAAPSAMPALMSAGGEFGAPSSSLPTDASTYQELMRRIQEILGPEAVDRQALLTQMKA